MEMNDKIKEITEKIEREGLEKARKESDRMIQKAREEAGHLIEEARKDAERIRAEAKKEAEDFSERIRSEVLQSQLQALSGLKREITELIQTHALGEPVKSSMEDRKFVQRLLESVVKNWRESTDNPELQVLLPEDQLESAEAYFRKRVNGLMNNGLEFKPHPGISRGFEIQPLNGHYRISMTDEAFEEFIRHYFKPRTAEFLFGGKKK